MEKEVKNGIESLDRKVDGLIGKIKQRFEEVERRVVFLEMELRDVKGNATFARRQSNIAKMRLDKLKGII